MANSKAGLPIQESLDKPPPYSVPESGDQPDFALTMRPQRESVMEGVSEDTPTLVNLAQRIGNLTLADIAYFLYKGILAILKIEKENIRQREEMKKKVKEIRNNRMKEIGDSKRKLEEQVAWSFALGHWGTDPTISAKKGFMITKNEKCRPADRQITKAQETDNFSISKSEDDKLERQLIETSSLVATCGLEISHLQGLVSRLESEARNAVWWITFQLFAALVCGMIYYHWPYAKETGETGITMQSVLVLGMIVILCVRKAQEFSNNTMLTRECKEVKSELDGTQLDYLNCREAVVNKLPEQKKLLCVVESSLEGQKCKTE